MRKPAMLTPGYMILRGPQGIGKTSLAVAMLCNDYRYHNKQRVATARLMCAQYRVQNDGHDLTIAPHLYFTNIRVLLDPRKNVVTHYVDTQLLTLPNPESVSQYFPFGSVVFIQEADTQLFNRSYKETSVYLIALLKYVRHNGMTIIFDTQRDSALDLAVRKLATRILHLTSSGYKRFLWFQPRYEWQFLSIDNQLNEALKDLAKIGVKKVPIVTFCRYRFKGNVFSRYNSYSGRAYFLRGIVDYEYRQHPSESLNCADIEAYCTAHPLVAPKK